jgi:hypothetical protein
MENEYKNPSDLTAAVGGQPPMNAFYAKPTFWQLFWSRIGFSYHLGDEPKGSELLPGWVQTKIGLHFDFADRIRLLFAGKLIITSTVYMDSPSPQTCMSRMDWHILKPGAKFKQE